MKMLYMVLLLLISIPANALSEREIFNKLEGDWGRKTWYTTLLKTKSPRKAMLSNGNYLSHLSFPTWKSAENAEYHLIRLNFSFNEGTEIPFTKIKPLNGSFVFGVENAGGDSSKGTGASSFEKKAVIKFISDDEIQFIDPTQNKPITVSFVKIKPSLEEFVNAVVLSGEYADENGHRYRFHPDGTVDWNNKIYSYNINHRVNQTNCDFFDLKTSTETLQYAYTIEKGKLSLYTTKELNDSLDKFGDPRLTLSRMR